MFRDPTYSFWTKRDEITKFGFKDSITKSYISDEK